jgi:hypothetical protein
VNHLAEPCDQKVGNFTDMPSANTDLRENGQDRMDWTDLAQDRDKLRVLVNTVTNIRVP